MNTLFPNIACSAAVFHWCGGKGRKNVRNQVDRSRWQVESGAGKGYRLFAGVGRRWPPPFGAMGCPMPLRCRTHLLRFTSTRCSVAALPLSGGYVALHHSLRPTCVSRFRLALLPCCGAWVFPRWRPSRNPPPCPSTRGCLPFCRPLPPCQASALLEGQDRERCWSDGGIAGGLLPSCLSWPALL